MEDVEKITFKLNQLKTNQLDKLERVKEVEKRIRGLMTFDTHLKKKLREGFDKGRLWTDYINCINNILGSKDREIRELIQELLPPHLTMNKSPNNNEYMERDDFFKKKDNDLVFIKFLFILSSINIYNIFLLFFCFYKIQ